MSLDRHTGRGQAREKTVAEVLLGALELPENGTTLIADDAYEFVAKPLLERSANIAQYWRVASAAHSAAPWPSGGPYDAATLRLSKDKGAFEMALHALASVLKPQAPIWVYGANDEGIKSVSKKLKDLFTEVETIDTRRHCRVIRGYRSAPCEGLRSTLQDWSSEMVLEHTSGDVSHRFYPGIFAKGKLDPATALLLDAVPTPEAGSRVLDYACGAGVIGGALIQRQPELQLTLIDADAIAVEAAKQNVPQANSRVSADPMNIANIGPLDLIVSNPPIHDGKERDYATVKRLIESAAHHLKPGAALWMVVQRQVPVAEHLNNHLAAAMCVKTDGRFNVWRAVRS